MAEYIEREALIKHIQDVYCVGCNSYHGVRCRACGTGDAIDMIEDAPAADVAPVVHARWVHDGRRFDGAVDWFHCSACKAPESGVYVSKPYCSNCGAKMDGDSEHTKRKGDC